MWMLAAFTPISRIDQSSHCNKIDLPQTHGFQRFQQVSGQKIKVWLRYGHTRCGFNAPPEVKGHQIMVGHHHHHPGLSSSGQGDIYEPSLVWIHESLAEIWVHILFDVPLRSKVTKLFGCPWDDVVSLCTTFGYDMLKSCNMLRNGLTSCLAASWSKNVLELMS